MFSDELLRKFLERFDCNLDRYAVGRPSETDPTKYNYFKVKREGQAQPLTFEVLREHLEGRTTIGVYPIRGDATTRWFAIDFDSPKDLPLDQRYRLAEGAARHQQRAFFQAGLFTYLERSRSGTGVHLWGFLRESMPAGIVRRAILPLLLSQYNHLIDRGKIYPADPDASENHTLICLPYGGAWAPEGCTVFLRNKDGASWELSEFLEEAKINGNEAVERLAAKAAPIRAVRQGKSAGALPGGEGRPTPLLDSGIMKIFSPLGCDLLHHVVRDAQETGARRVTEPEWYAALGQLTAFERGREAAHLISALDPRYNAQQTDEKYDHACKAPPNGCASIHEKFPQWACKGCPMTAPYRRAEQSLVELSTTSVGDLEQGQYTEDRKRIERRNSGRELAGIHPGVQGLDKYVRLRNNELIGVGAQPSIGKTALFVDMACNIAASGVDVYAFSAESSREVIHDRLIAHESLIDSRALRGERPMPLREEEWAQVDLAIEQLKKLPIFENYAATRPDDMLRLIEADRLSRRVPWNAPYVVLFDYLQYGLAVEPGESGAYRAINRRLDELKTLRRVLVRPVVFFSQLTRDSEGKKEPALNWWRGSGNIEAIIDGGWILTGDRIEGLCAPRTLHVVKQKEGIVGAKVEYVLHQAVCRWEARGEVARPVEPDPIFESWTV